MEAKLADVTQKDVTKQDVMKTRYISAPRLEVNSRIINDSSTKCVAPTHANVARRILYSGARYPATPALISKRDVKA